MTLLLIFPRGDPPVAVVAQRSFRFRITGGSVNAPLNDPFS